MCCPCAGTARSLHKKFSFHSALSLGQQLMQRGAGFHTGLEAAWLLGKEDRDKQTCRLVTLRNTLELGSQVSVLFLHLLYPSLLWFLCSPPSSSTTVIFFTPKKGSAAAVCCEPPARLGSAGGGAWLSLVLALASERRSGESGDRGWGSLNPARVRSAWRRAGGMR